MQASTLAAKEACYASKGSTLLYPPRNSLNSDTFKKEEAGLLE